jgi:hypothetical protein
MKNLFLFTVASYLILSSCGSSTNDQVPTAPPINQEQPEKVVEKPAEEERLPEVKKTNEYTGTFYGEIDGSLTFDSDKSVRGKFYDLHSNTVYRLKGTNYVDGVVEAEIIIGGGDIYYGTLRKSLTNRYIVWSGNFQHGHNVDEDGNLAPGGEYFEIRRLR